MIKLMDKEKVMRKGSEFAKQFKGLSVEQINKILEDKQNRHDEEITGMYAKQQVGFHGKKAANEVMDEYGLIEYERNKILRFLLAEAKAKQLVDKIPPKAFAETKKKFDNIRDISLITRYGYPQEEIRSIIKSVFGNHESQISWLDEDYLNIADIAEAFETREKELQKPAKGRWWDKVKNLFSNFGKGKKALPEPMSEEANKEAGIRENIVPPEGKKLYQEHAKEVADKFNADSTNPIEMLKDKSEGAR